jgi:4'-phosphopantetheinyl transferase
MSRITSLVPQVQLLPVPHGDDEPSDLQPLLALLDSEERNRVARFRFARDRNLYVRAHVLLRQVLSRHADVAPEDWRFEQGVDGKPALCRYHHPALHDLHFNLSHCQGMAAMVVARGREVGIDVEHLDAMKDPDELAATILAPAEQTQWRRIGNDVLAQQRFLLERWTLKEAALKAHGSGLGRHPPETLSFAQGTRQCWMLYGPARLSPSGRPWQFATATLGHHPHPVHHLAVAIEPSDDNPSDELQLVFVEGEPNLGHILPAASENDNRNEQNA